MKLDPEIEIMAEAIHLEDSVVPWKEAHADRRKACIRMARTINSARLLGQSVTDAANRLIVWWQLDEKFEGRKGRATAPSYVAAKMDELTMAAIKALARE